MIVDGLSLNLMGTENLVLQPRESMPEPHGCQTSPLTPPVTAQLHSGPAANISEALYSRPPTDKKRVSPEVHHHFPRGLDHRG